MQRSVGLYCAIAAVALAAATTPVEAARTYSLRSQRGQGVVDRVELALQVGGDLKVVQQSKVKPLKMSVLAQLAYDEKSLHVSGDSGGPLRSIRHYDKAAAVIKVEDQETKPTLRPKRRLIGVQIDQPTVTLFSPHGPLSRDELDLIDLLGNSLLLDRLLPQEPVAVGDRWRHSGQLMAALLGLDAVSQTDVESVLAGAADGTANLEMSGRVEGAVNGVSTKIALKAKYQFNLKTGRIGWFALAVREDRSIGHVGPGLEAVARLQMKISPLGQSPRLADAALAGLSLKPTAQLTQLEYESAEGGWKFLHDRKWFATGDEEHLAVLRLIDRGEFVAQCKIHTLPDATPGKQITLADFQDDIKHGLGESFKQFVQAGQRSNDTDYRVYRVVAAGEVEQLPIQWIYYLVADKQGHQVVFAFTVEGSLLDRFEGADQQLLGTLRLADPRVASRPSAEVAQ